MKKILFLMMMFLVVTGCSKEEESDSFIKTTDIEIVNEYTAIKGDIFSIPYKIHPENATDKGITITSSNPYVLSVQNDGSLSANSQGEATITLKSSDGFCEASCNISVKYMVGLKWFAGLCNSVPQTSEDVHKLPISEYYLGPESYQFKSGDWKKLVICIPYNNIEEVTTDHYAGNILNNKTLCTGPIIIPVIESMGGRLVNYKMWVIQADTFNKADTFYFKTQGNSMF